MANWHRYLDANGAVVFLNLDMAIQIAPAAGGHASVKFTNAGGIYSVEVAEQPETVFSDAEASNR